MKYPDRKGLKRIALIMAVLMINQVVFPTIALALTGGPSQPEVKGFQPVGTTEMVDLFTGDFSYNIPLLDVDGYPVNLAYQSNPGMDEEASWVGLGWSLNPGVINREVRGFPDDFKRESVYNYMNLRDNFTIGGSAAFSAEFFGFFGISVGTGTYYNNYRGWGKTFSVSPSISAGKSNCGLSANLGLSFDSQNGLDITRGMGLSYEGQAGVSKVNLSAGFNSRSGFKELTLGFSQGLVIQKNDNFSFSTSLSHGTSYNFSRFTYFPTRPLGFKSHALSFNGSLGGELFGLHGSIRATGYYNEQTLSINRLRHSAFGYMYSSEVDEDDNPTLDYNKEQQVVYREDMPNLPVAFGTYDLFNASGQGVSGQFRTVRGDVGIFHGRNTVNNSSAESIGGEFGWGNAFHGGGDFAVTQTVSKAGKWEEDNEVTSILNFSTNNTDPTLSSAVIEEESLFEPAYFKEAGEKSSIDEDFFNKTGGTLPVRLDLSNGTTTIAKKNFRKEKNRVPQGNIYLQNQVKKKERQRRNQLMSYLTAGQADEFGLDKGIKSYPLNRDTVMYCDTEGAEVISRKSQKLRSHHLSELTVTKEDGSRYVYGIPAYNNLQKEVSFNVNSSGKLDSALTQGSTTFGLIEYSPGDGDNTIGNHKGKDYFMDARIIPPYTHSFLLTGVLSPDYVDRTGDGITDDDIGNAVKLNYSRLTEEYEWRVPYEQNMGRFQEGYKSVSYDDKASYLYGQKEIWYLHSIESRTMKALFYTSPRNDALGVLDENGGRDTLQRLEKLDSIRLYNKADLMVNGVDAVPIKTVHFEYNYNSCKGVPNQKVEGDGKLTLEKVYFTYGNSKRGKLNAYVFGYKTQDDLGNDYDYNIGFYDRWGNYKINPAGYPTNLDFPYCIQDSVIANRYAGAWNLNQITLPSGGEINIDYEPDDYAYLQDRRAGQMVRIAGFSNSADAYVATPSQNLYQSGTVNNYIVVELPENSVSSEAEMKYRYLDDIPKIYFHCLTNLDNKTNHDDYVFGYMDYDIDGVRLQESGSLQQMFIPVNLVSADKGGSMIHPITKAALQLVRMNIPELAYPYSYNANNSFTAALKSVIGLASEIKNIVDGFDKSKIRENWAKKVTPSASWIRLNNPDFRKYGGGSRVKKIALSDEWNITDGGGPSEYGQTYTYTTEAIINGVKETISSGVASYEPAVGGEENSLKQPLPYKEKILLAPDNFYYTETPVGEPLYPGPMVGYSEVKVRTLNNDIERTGTGYSIHRFYTAKDFPVTSDFTNLKKGTIPRGNKNPVIKFLKLGAKDHVTASQGFVIELNDMHGKMKEESVYNEHESLISSTLYRYKTDDNNASTLHLDNEVQIVKPDGSVTTGILGLETDIWHEMQEDGTEITTIGAAGNGDGFFFGIIPGFAVTVFPIYQNESTRLRTSVTTKLVKRFGVLDEVIVTENGSTITTENVLFDSETGNVLLTKTQNEFDDPVYQFTYPAHWAYEGMDLAYRNIGVSFDSIAIAGGKFATSGFTPELFFTPGDELSVAVHGSNTYFKYFVVRDEASGDLIVAGINGLVYSPVGTTLADIKVIRSGKRNQASAPIGTITLLDDPASGSDLDFSGTDVLSAEANVFSDLWRACCTREVDTSAIGLVYEFVSEEINPYQVGIKGNWRLSKPYVFYNIRNPEALQVTNIRTDGAVEAFYPFWTAPAMAGDYWTPTSNTAKKWLNTNEVTNYDLRGNEIENIDPFSVRSCALHGFKGSRVIAVARNSEKQFTAYDGFEDYYFDDTCSVSSCEDTHILFGDYIDSGDLASIAHTGKHSLKSTEESKKIAQLIAHDACFGEGGEAGYFQLVDNVIFKNECKSCLPQFQPYTGNSYISCWVATDSSLLCGKPIEEVGLVIQRSLIISSIENTYYDTLRPSGPVIDGWQRIDARKILNGYKVIIRLLNEDDSENGHLYMDDFRAHQFSGNTAASSEMKSFVYDPWSLRLMAELDENNYATFYEYDDEGMLIRVKRETDRGIMTVREARTVMKPNNTID